MEKCCGIISIRSTGERTMEKRPQEHPATGYFRIRSMIAFIRTNVASYSMAIANGMKKVKPDAKNQISYVYAITREAWESMK